RFGSKEYPGAAQEGPEKRGIRNSVSTAVRIKTDRLDVMILSLRLCMVKIPLQDLKCAVSGFASSRLPKSAADKEPAKKTGASQDRKLPHAAPLPSPFPVVCRCSFRMG